MKVEEMPRASEGDIVELEGKISHAQKPNEGQYGWSQFIGVKDDTGEQNCWIRLEGEEDKVTKGTSIKIKGKLGEEYEDKKSKKMVRSINNCDFEVIGKVQDPAQKSTQSTQGNGNGKDNYWEKKFEWDKKVQAVIIRECAIKAVTELAKIPPSKTFLIKVHTEKDFFNFADKIKNYILKRITSEDIKKEFGGTSEEEITKEFVKQEYGGTAKVVEKIGEQIKEGAKAGRIAQAKGIVGKTEFKPASTKQKNVIFGYTDKDGYHKGMIDSRYIETPEIKEIGDPKKLSVDEASEWIEFWWGEQGNPDDIGARKQREIDNPRDENGKPVNALIKGDKTSLTKDMLIDQVNALRRENRLNDDAKFKKEMGYNPKLEELTEAELTKLKDILKRYVPF